MSTEREIVDKFKEAMETKNPEVLLPYLAEDMSFSVLPSTSVVVPPGSTSWY